MKTKQTLVCGLLAVIFALAFIACDDGSGSDKKFTVTFDSNGGSDVSAQTVADGGKATKPADPTKASGPTAGLWSGTPASSSYTFAGWQKGGAAYDFDAPVTADITLTAKWTVTSSGTPINLATRSEANIIAKSVAYINADTGATTEYTLVLDANVTDVAEITHNKDDVTLTITSDGTTERIISKGTENGNLFYVGGIQDISQNTVLPKSAILVIDGNITLQGKENDNVNRALVYVVYGGSLELKGNAKITSGSVGGVEAVGASSPDAYVTITMSGNAEISNNTRIATNPQGGGVQLSRYATLTMSDNASIKNNGVVGRDQYWPGIPEPAYSNHAQGGGVYIDSSCTFTMNGGEISGNYAKNNDNGTAQGGGVFIENSVLAKFIVASEAVKANIKNNTVISNDGIEKSEQVYKQTYGVFTVGGVDAATY